MKMKTLYRVVSVFIMFCLFGSFASAESRQRVRRELGPRSVFSAKKGGDKDFSFSGGKGKIRIPAQSLDTDETIEVQRVEIDYDARKFRQMGDVHRFGPHGLRFKKPVLLTLPYTEPSDFSEELVHIYYYNETRQAWDIMEKVAQDKENNTITVKIHHFSDYAPGVGSYMVEEGLSPNSSFFKNNNERVDRYRGNLIIERTDVNIPGRGLDLVVQTTFNSDWYYWNTAQKKSTWGWESEIEDKGVYKIADGWHFKFPAVFYKQGTTEPPPPEYHGSIIVDEYKFMTENGVIYDLTNIMHWHSFNSITDGDADLEGYRFYNMGDKKIMEIIREKIVLECTAEPGDFQTQYKDFKAYYPDGRIVEFFDPQTNGTGKVSKIFDAAGINCLDFNYFIFLGIIRITDSCGRTLKFDYSDGNNITLSLNTGSSDIKLIKYEVNSNNKLTAIHYL